MVGQAFSLPKPFSSLLNHMEKLTRRDLAVMVAGSLATAAAIAQTPPSAANPDWYQAALESHKENSGFLARFQIPISTGPAFQFKA